LAVTLVGVIAILSDFGIRMLWWGGGRRGRSDRNGAGGAFIILFVLGLVLLVLSPIIARVMQLAVSRRRESLADVSGVELTRYPPGLISALKKLEEDQTVVASSSRATAHLWIEQPLARTPEEGRLSRINRLFDTHPPLAERIQALEQL
jgi:heat shock protein HtpX